MSHTAEAGEAASLSLTTLPSEVLVTIFLNLDWNSLEALESTSAHFRLLIRSSLLIWSRKAADFRRRNGLTAEFPPPRLLGRRAGAWRRFYGCLRRLEKNVLEGHFTTR